MDIYIRRYLIWLRQTGLDLKQHQLDGVRWCLNLEDHSVGGIIADEMGLGKTYMMMGLIVANRKRHNLIVVPPALLEQWKSCLERYIGGKHLYIYHRAFNNIKNTSENDLSSLIVLTSYFMLNKLNKKGGRKWDRIIYDEAHHLRNGKTRKSAGAFQIKSDVKWCVTGTPIQNKMSDLYTLCDLIGITHNLDEIKSNYMLKRTKEEAGIVLPKMNEENIIVSWESNKERKLAELIHGCVNFEEIIDASLLDSLNGMKAGL